jgi:hypothetical protein
MGAWRDRWVIAALAGALALLAYGISRHGGRLVELGSPEYADYIQGQITACVRRRLAADRERNHGDIRTMPIPLDRESTCRFVVEEFDRQHSETRPYRYQ